MKNVDSPLGLAAKNYPEHLAIISDRARLTYAGLERAVQSAMARFTNVPLKAGMRVAIFLPNSLEYVICLIAFWRLKITPCLLNTRWPSQLVESAIKDLKCPYVICAPDILPTSPGAPFKKINVYDMVNLNVAFEPTKKIFSMSLAQAASVVFTSGTTAKPKAAVHSFGNHYYNAKGASENIPVDKNDRWLLSLPLYHVGGLGIVFRMLLSASTLVIPSSGTRLIRVIGQHKVTHISVVPTQLMRLFDLPYNFKVLARLKAILIGGSAIPDYLIAKSLERKLPIYKTYGLTEMSSQVATTTFDDAKNGRLGGGVVLPFRQVTIAPDGEILVKGETLFLGYLKNGNLNLPVDSKGWFKTGDLGYINEQKRLIVNGRKDNMFISGGENIYPEEIEEKMRLFVEIRNVLVIPIEDAEYGARPVAFIKSKNKARIRARDLIEHLSGYLPKFKIPDEFYHWPWKEEQDVSKVNRRQFSRHFQDNTKDFKKLRN